MPPGRKVPRRGEVYWIDPNPQSGRETKDRHRFIVVTPEAINALGVSITVPVYTGGLGQRQSGMAVVLMGSDTTGAAICNQVRSFDIEARIRAGTARYVETLDPAVADEIAARVASIIDPEPEA